LYLDGELIAVYHVFTFEDLQCFPHFQCPSCTEKFFINITLQRTFISGLVTQAPDTDAT